MKTQHKPVNKISSVFFKNDTSELKSAKDLSKFRPNTSTQRNNTKNKDIRFSTFYDNKNFYTPKKNTKNKTEGA